MKTKPLMNREAVARAKGYDAGNESMRKAGRNKWSLADYQEAVRVQTEILEQ
jgi:hypothetical protein